MTHFLRHSPPHPTSPLNRRIPVSAIGVLRGVVLGAVLWALGFMTACSWGGW